MFILQLKQNNNSLRAITQESEDDVQVPSTRQNPGKGSDGSSQSLLQPTTAPHTRQPHRIPPPPKRVLEGSQLPPPPLHTKQI